MGASADDTIELVVAARRRVIAGVGAIAAGFVLARWLHELDVHAPTWWWFVAGAAASLACALIRPGAGPWRGRGMRLCALCAAVLLGAGWFGARAVDAPPDRLDALVAPDSIIAVTGRVSDAPRRARDSTDVLARFRLRPAAWVVPLVVREAEGGDGNRTVSGSLTLLVEGEAPPAVRAGDVVRATGTFQPNNPPQNPGDEANPYWDVQEGRVGVLHLVRSGEGLIEHRPPNMWDRALAPILRARAALRERAQRVVLLAAGDDPAHRVLFESLMLGRVSEGAALEQGEVAGVFARLGLVHVLSISGFHLTVMAALALWLVRVSGDRGRVEPLILAVIVLAYMAVVPASSPILRSGAMVLSLLVVEASGRKYDRLCVLGWVAVALLAWRPMDLWSLGFQLSLGLTAVLLSAGERFPDILFAPTLRGLMPERTLPLRVWARARDGLRSASATSVMCWVVALPAIAHTTGLVSPLAVLATLLVSPLIVALLWVGYGALLVGVFIPGAALGASWVVDRFGAVTLWASGVMDDAPFSSLRVPVVPAWWAVLATVAALVWVHGWGSGDRWGSFGPLARRSLFASSLLSLPLVWFVLPPLAKDASIRVDALSVGDGTCVIVRSGRDALLWDCNAVPSAGSGSLPGIARAARRVGAWRIPRVVISHPDLDHFSGLPEVIEPLGVEEVLVSARFVEVARRDDNGAPASLLAHLHDRGVALRVISADHSLALGSAKMRFLWPGKGVPEGEDNNHSLVALVEPDNPVVGGILLTGDITPPSIRTLCESIPAAALGRVAVMEAPHHGSHSPESAAWMVSVAPTAVVQSTGPQRMTDPRWNPVRHAVPTGPIWHSTAERGWAGIDVRKGGRVVLTHMR